MTPDCRVVLLEQFRLAEPLDVHSLRSLSVPSFSFLGHDSFLIYGRRTTERTNRRTENEAPSLPSFLHSAAAELPRCSLGCLGNDLTCLPLSLSIEVSKGIPNALREKLNLVAQPLFHYFVHPCLSFYLSRAAAVAALSPSPSLRIRLGGKSNFFPLTQSNSAAVAVARFAVAAVVVGGTEGKHTPGGN